MLVAWNQPWRSIYTILLFSHPVMSDSLQPHGLQHTRPPCPSSFPKVCPSSCPFHWWCHLILWCPLLLPSIFPSIRYFSSESAVHIRWPKYWSFTFNISPSSEYSELISLKIYWFDLLAVQGTLRSLLQHHSSKVSVLQCSTFFIVQLSQLYMTTGKTITLTVWTFVIRIMSLLFNTLSKFVIAFHRHQQTLEISWVFFFSSRDSIIEYLSAFHYIIPSTVGILNILTFLIQCTTETCKHLR